MHCFYHVHAHGAMWLATAGTGKVVSDPVRSAYWRFLHYNHRYLALWEMQATEPEGKKTVRDSGKKPDLCKIFTPAIAL